MKTVFLTLAIVFSAFSAEAQQQPAISSESPLLGPSLEGSYRLGPNFGWRGLAKSSSNFNHAPLSRSTNIGLLSDLYLEVGGPVTTGEFPHTAIDSNSKAQLESDFSAPSAARGGIITLPFVKRSVSFAF